MGSRFKDEYMRMRTCQRAGFARKAREATPHQDLGMQLKHAHFEACRSKEGDQDEAGL